MTGLKAYPLAFIAICMVLGLSSFNPGCFRSSASKKQINFPVKTLVPNLTIVDVRVEGLTNEAIQR